MLPLYTKFFKGAPLLFEGLQLEPVQFKVSLQFKVFYPPNFCCISRGVDVQDKSPCELEAWWDYTCTFEVFYF